MKNLQTCSLQQQVYEKMKEQIMDGEIPLGYRLVENELAHRYNVSRTPVRKAIAQLAADGLVESIPGEGQVVRCPTLSDIEEITAIMVTLSDLLVKHTMKKLTEQKLAQMYAIADEIDQLLAENRLDEATARCDAVHDAIWEAAGMPYLVTVMDALPKFWRYKCIGENISQADHIASILEHRTLIDLVRDKDAKGYHDLFQKHMEDISRNCQYAYGRLLKNSKTEIFKI